MIMNPETLFSISNTSALAGWLLLIVQGRRRWVSSLITGAVVPGLLSVLYAALITLYWGSSGGGFGSIAQVRLLFANDWLLLAGWVHYLAFDLFIGSWQVRDAQQQGIPHMALIPGLILTFFFGPAGLLVYLGIRVVRGKTLALAR